MDCYETSMYLCNYSLLVNKWIWIMYTSSRYTVELSHQTLVQSPHSMSVVCCCCVLLEKFHYIWHAGNIQPNTGNLESLSWFSSICPSVIVSLSFPFSVLFCWGGGGCCWRWRWYIAKAIQQVWFSMLSYFRTRLFYFRHQQLHVQEQRTRSIFKQR